MKRICFLVDSIFSIGGVQRVTAVIAEALTDDYQVTIATFDKPETMNTQLYDLHNYGLNYQFLSYPAVKPWKNKLCKAYSYLFRKVIPQTPFTSKLYSYSSFPSEKRNYLASHLNAGHFDVIIGVHSFLAIRLATIRSQLGNAKLMGWIHNSFDALLRHGSPYLGTELKKHYGWQIQKLQTTIVLYHQDAQLYQQAFGFLPTVIYNPLTLKPGKPSDGTAKRFLAVGRFSPLHKGFDLLIQAFALFSQHNTDWTLDIVGEGPEEQMLRTMVKELGVNDRISIHPFTNDIQSYYSAASIYVLSSRWEGMPLVLVEAMAHGLPIVSSDLPTSQEVLGSSGIFFKNGDINDLAQQLEWATHTDWHAQSAQAFNIASYYSLPRIAEEWKKILET